MFTFHLRYENRSSKGRAANNLDREKWVQCGNFSIFLSLRFYVKSIFWHFGDFGAQFILRKNNIQNITWNRSPGVIWQTSLWGRNIGWSFWHYSLKWSKKILENEVLTTGNFFMWSKMLNELKWGPDDKPQYLMPFFEKRSSDFFEVYGAKNITWNRSSIPTFLRLNRGFAILLSWGSMMKKLRENKVSTFLRWGQKYYVKATLDSTIRLIKTCIDLVDFM